MKTFVAYRSTGEDPKRVGPLLTAMRDAFSNKGIDFYATFFNEQEFKANALDKRQIMQHAFRIIDGSNFLFVLVTSDNKSEGMLMEVGYCLAKGIPIVAAVKDDVKSTYISDIARANLPWSDVEGLVEAIRNFDFAAITG